MAAALSNLHPAVDLKLLDQIANSGGHPYSLCVATVAWQESRQQVRDDGSISTRRSSGTVDDDRGQLMGRRLKDVALECGPFQAGKPFRRKSHPSPISAF